MKIIGYAPDLDPTIEGIITDCAALVPSERGMKGAPSAEDLGYAALAAQCYGAGTYRRLDDSFRTVAGTSTKLYELISSAWTDRTRAIGGNYSVGVDSVWRFAQFGDTLLAANKADTLQASTTGAFSDVSGAPKAAIVETVGDRVVLADTNDGTYGDQSNRWWVSGQRDHTDWTPNASGNGCATNTIVSTPGGIKAAKRFGNQVVFYKERSMYIGTFVGAPVVLDVQPLPGVAGASCQEAVVDVGTAENPMHIFMGADDFWRFDGSRAVPLGSPLRRTVYADLNATYANRIKTLHDRVNSRIYFYYPSNAGAGSVDKCVVYHYRQNVWGRDDRTIEAVLEYLSGGITYDTLDTLYATYDSMTNTSYNSALFTQGTPKIVYFDTSHTMQSLTGTTGNSSVTLGDYGDDTNYYLLSRLKVVWLTKPASATFTNFYKDNEGDSYTTDQTTTMSSSRFDVLRSARWHSGRIDMSGDHEFSTFNAELMQDGLE